VAAGERPAGAPQVAINARAAARAQVGGVERLAREMVARLPELRPDRYRVIRPFAALAHRAGHLWEQAVLPVQARGCALLYSPANLGPVLSRRNVLVVHDAASLRHPEAYSRPYVAYQRRMLPALARRARLLITVSEFSKRELVEVLGVAPERITVIPEGVDERFGVGADPAAASALYGLARPYVLALGTMSERKNLGVLGAAGRALRERGIELVVAGSDRAYLRASPVPLRRLGYVAEEHLAGLYAGARALAMPSRYEGFGLPCLEAMACGTPVVAAASGALPETVGDAGLLVDANDGEAFASALVAAACDQQIAGRLAEAGRRRAAAFPWSRTAALTDAAIGDLLPRE
jgi:glycosyltransferase involved in cell wall biosynthesis